MQTTSSKAEASTGDDSMMSPSLRDVDGGRGEAPEGRRDEEIVDFGAGVGVEGGDGGNGIVGEGGGAKGAKKEKEKTKKVKKVERRGAKKRAKDESEACESTLEGREGWGKLSARNVLDAVDKAKDVTLGR